MRCPKCKSDNSICKDSRQRGDHRWRRYFCRSCKTIYETTERVAATYTQNVVVSPECEKK